MRGEAVGGGQATVQSVDWVPPKSLARDMALSCNRGSCPLRRRCRLRSYTAICLQSNKLSCSVRADQALAQNAQWRMATLRLGATPDAGPRSMCALRKGNDGEMCEQSMAEHPFSTLRRLIAQAGGCADVERHAPELYEWVRNDNDAAPKVRCAIFDVVFWFQGVLQQLWTDVNVRCPHATR